MSSTLLLIDDDAAVRDSLHKVLREAGYAVQAAATGQAGLDLLETQSFDLLLLDLHLPDCTGWEVFERATSRCPLLPVILITALSGQRETEAAAAVGALLEKPLDALILLQTIERLLAEPSEVRLRRLQAYVEHTRRIPAVGAGYLERMPAYPSSHFDRTRRPQPGSRGKNLLRPWRNPDQQP